MSLPPKENALFKRILVSDGPGGPGWAAGGTRRPLPRLAPPGCRGAEPRCRPAGPPPPPRPLRRPGHRPLPAGAGGPRGACQRACPARARGPRGGGAQGQPRVPAASAGAGRALGSSPALRWLRGNPAVAASFVGLPSAVALLSPPPFLFFF